MPKAQKPSQKISGAKCKQITDFFSRKPNLPQGTPPSASHISVVAQRNAKQSSTKENATSEINGRSLNTSASTNPIRSCLGSGTGSAAPAKTMTATSPMQPSTKRLRSQSIVSSRSTKHPKRLKNILPDSRFEEEKMEADNESVVYVRSRDSVASKSAPVHLPTSDPAQKKSRLSTSPGLRLEVDTLVPSSLSEEKELEPNHPEHKDIGMVREAVDHWRKRALPPSPATNASSPVESQVSKPSQSSSLVVADWDILDDATPSRHIPTTTFIPTPPSTGGLSDPQLELAPIDARARTEQIIADIRARAYAVSRATSESPPLMSDIEGPDSSEDENDAFGDLGLKSNQKLVSQSRRSSKLPEPGKCSLRDYFPHSQQASSSRVLHDTSPSPATRKPSMNPLDALLREKRTLKHRKSAPDKEARISGLADLNLDDDSDGGSSIPDQADGNPFIDDNQKQQVLGIFKGDRDIETEEECLQQQSNAGVLLWGSLASHSMDVCDGPLSYCGQDPVLRTFVRTVAQGNHALVQLSLRSGALESADYTDGGSNVIGYLKDLAFFCLKDDRGPSALRVLTQIWVNPTSTEHVALFETVLNTLHALGAEPSVLESLGWSATIEPRNDVSDIERSIIIGRLVHCIADIAKARRLHPMEIPDVVAALLLVTMDPSTRHETKLQICRAIHEMCESVGDKDEVETEVECGICNKVLRLIGPYTPRNKCCVLDVFASASGRTARIARLMAHAMLTDKPVILPSQYSSLPPLSEIITTIKSFPRDANHLGKFEIHEKTDYAGMACWTSVLAVALNDVPLYMEDEESRKVLPSPIISPSKEKDQSLVLALYHELYKIHGRIQDTRAARLDRSRTKAVIFQTAFRIQYQYQAINRYRTTSGRNIHHYFQRK